MMKHNPQNLSLNLNTTKGVEGNSQLTSFKIEIIEIEIFPQKGMQQISPQLHLILDKQVQMTDAGKYQSSNRIEFKEVK